MFRRDRPNNEGGGGVMVFISKAYSLHSLEINDKIESINFSIRIEEKYCLYSCI